ncbi:hypothetical protein ILUMI_04528 [Ignelater luminosus]|uniref:Uncharacterized protein n=1 Tax=Ignelater luminosus TaxID=2038154 RepID=A0A8K0GL34_IGNLU|nr:hypothetical protein ILUMI_04528 [Ignelater luminosus]
MTEETLLSTGGTPTSIIDMGHELIPIATKISEVLEAPPITGVYTLPEEPEIEDNLEENTQIFSATSDALLSLLGFVPVRDLKHVLVLLLGKSATVHYSPISYPSLGFLRSDTPPLSELPLPAGCSLTQDPPNCCELNKNPVEGFSAGLIDDNDIYRWEVLIIGPPDTL